jgi:predicted nucleic acid-binding protein
VAESADEIAYKRGQQDAVVAEHTKHLDKINGTLERVSDQLTKLFEAMLRAAEQSAARDAVAVATAQTVKDTRQASIDHKTEEWKPWQKFMAVVAGLIGLAAFAILVYSTFFRQPGA